MENEVQRNKKLLLVTSNFTLGGTERSILNLYKLLLNRDFDVKLLRFYKKNQVEFVSGLAPDSLNINLTENKIIRFFRLQIKLMFYLSTMRDYKVVLYNNKYLFFFVLPVLLFNIKLILSDRNEYKNRNFLRQSIYMFILNNFVYKVLVQSEYTKKLYQSELNCKDVFVLRNFIDKEDYNFTIAKKIPNNNKIIYTTGRLISSKNHELIIRAFALHSRSHSWSLRIYGQGPLELSLRSLITDLNLEDRIVILPGNLESMSSNSIFIFLSESEGFPNALQEALFSCIPCIVYKYNDSLLEIIKDDETRMLEELNQEKVASAILEMIFKVESFSDYLFERYRSVYNKRGMQEIENLNINFYKSLQ